MSTKNVLLVGTGYMATEYAKVLSAFHIPFAVVGRSKKSVLIFRKKTGISAVSGGIRSWLPTNSRIFTHAIVAVNEQDMTDVALGILHAGIKNILIEKPGGLVLDDLRSIERGAKRRKANVFVAYNRRFYGSVAEARKILARDGGLLSIHFEFTEWTDQLRRLKLSSVKRRQWFFLNSSHVVDLAFFLAGVPRTISCFKTGAASWFPRAPIYTGAGVTAGGVLFSYHANWESAGRWGIELYTRKHKIILRPLEKLFVQKRGSLEVHEHTFDAKDDTKFKPGLAKQVRAFLSGVTDNLPSIAEQLQHFNYYKKIDPSLS